MTRFLVVNTPVREGNCHATLQCLHFDGKCSHTGQDEVLSVLGIDVTEDVQLLVQEAKRTGQESIAARLESLLRYPGGEA